MLKYDDKTLDDFSTLDARRTDRGISSQIYSIKTELIIITGNARTKIYFALVSKYADVMYDKGNGLESSGRYEEAIKSYNRILELKPDYVAAWYHKGLSLYNLKKYQDALSSYDKALEIEPKNANAWNNKGLSLAELRKYEDAISSYDKALMVEPSHNEARINKRNIVSKYADVLACYDKEKTLKKFLSELMQTC